MDQRLDRQMNVPSRPMTPDLSINRTEAAMDSASSDATPRRIRPESTSAGSSGKTDSFAARMRRALAHGFGITKSPANDGSALRLAVVGRTAVSLGLITPAQLTQAEVDAEASRREGRREGPGAALSRNSSLSARQIASLLARHATGYQVSTDAALLASRLQKAIADQRRSILICGLRRSDESDVVAAGAAVAMALTSDAPVAIVDCNFRQPSAHSLFGFDQSTGALAVMSGAARLETALCDTGVAELAVMPAEQTQGSPSLEFSEETALRNLVTPLENRGVVIVCAAPLLESPETLMLASHLGHTLLVTAANVGRGADLQDAEGLLSSVGAKPLGVLLARSGRS
jgi:Mrp family chromosome partitioning ATPase